MSVLKRSVSEVEPAGQRLAVGIPKRIVDITIYFTLPRLDYDKQVCRLFAMLLSSTTLIMTGGD